MICLFADLSLYLAFRFSHLPAARAAGFSIALPTHTESRSAASARAAFPRECSSVFAIPYRDCNSNPLATVLPRRCQPLVTRII
jgi:hypothetical protein